MVSSGCDTGSGFPQVYAEMRPCLEIQAKAISPHKIVGGGMDYGKPVHGSPVDWSPVHTDGNLGLSLILLSVTVPSINTGKTNKMPLPMLIGIGFARAKLKNPSREVL